MLRTRLLVLPALAALALTACGGSGPSTAAGGSGPGGAGPGGKDAMAVVQAAARDTTATGSSKFALTSTTAIGGQDVTFAGEGAFDYAAKTGQLTFNVPGADGSASGGGSIEERLIGPDLYLTLPQMPGVFYRLKTADVAGTSLGGSTDPTASLSALQGITEVKEVGKERVRGEQATHYQGTYDVKKALSSVTGTAKTLLQGTLGSTTLSSVPFDAYLDGKGRLVKFAQELELPATAQTGGKKLTSKTVLELFDFGTTVTVAAPPAAQVRNGAPLLAALKGAAPAPSPAS